MVTFKNKILRLLPPEPTLCDHAVCVDLMMDPLSHFSTAIEGLIVLLLLEVKDKTYWAGKRSVFLSVTGCYKPI